MTIKQLSKYKWEKLGVESLRNGLNLHLDSILLFCNNSFSTAFHISVLALEEIAKSNWITHYHYTSITNEGFPETEFEQKWLKLLYSHTAKQKVYVNRDSFDVSPKFLEFVNNGKLETKKQDSVYVGLKRSRKTIDTSGRISLPTKIKEKDAREIISLNNKVLTDQCRRNIDNGFYYGFYENFEILNKDTLEFLNDSWDYKSGIKTKKWETLRRKNWKNNIY